MFKEMGQTAKQYSDMLYSNEDWILFINCNNIQYIIFIKIRILMFKKILKIFIFILLAYSLHSQKINDNQGKMVIEANHISSSTYKNKEYTVSGIHKGRPLIIILKKNQKLNNKISQNPVQFKVKSNQKLYECLFNNDKDLCVLDQVNQEKLTFSVNCEKLPCQASWILEQPEVSQITGNKIGQGLFLLKQSQNHLRASITCNDPNIKTFEEDIDVYGENDYEKLSFQTNQVQLLFKTQQAGYIYINIEEASKQCAKLQFNQIRPTISFSDHQTIQDFTIKNSPLIYNLELTKKKFKISCVMQQHLQNQNQTLTFIISGIKGQKSQILQEININADQTAQTTAYEHIFSVLIDSFLDVQKLFDKFQIKFITKEDHIILLNLDFQQMTKEIPISLYQRNYFDLVKGEKIIYSVHPLTTPSLIINSFIRTYQKQKIITNVTQCSLKQGCKFQLTALADVVSSVYIGRNTTIKQSQYQVQVHPIVNDIVNQKIKVNAKRYYSYNLKKDKTIQVVINSPNVIMYAASVTKCNFPSDSCHEKKGNSRHPFIFKPTQDGTLMILVKGLDNTEFMLSIHREEDEFITLHDGLIFSYLIEQTQQEIDFKYTIQKNITVNFNLIAPLNNLLLIVTNSKSQKQNLQSVVSSDGYVTFTEQDIKQLDFRIKVKKTDLVKNKITHFTLLASTSDSVVRLDPTIMHYQYFEPSMKRQYIFEYRSSENYILNFDLHNVNDHQIKFNLMISDNQDWKSNKAYSYNIISQSDSLNINQRVKGLCLAQKAKGCEVFLKLQNQMEKEIEISMILLERNSIIQLKDGIWQTYQSNTIDQRASFYFYPRHLDKDTLIVYNTADQNLMLAYHLWKTDTKSINPVQWPFPSPKLMAQSQQHKQGPIKYINIDKHILAKECQPQCLVLLTLFRKQPNINKKSSKRFDYKIMASNNQIQLPEGMKINLNVKKQQEKHVIIDLSSALNNRQEINFYTSFTLGDFFIGANVISENNFRCPSVKESVDFMIKNGQTDILVKNIKGIMQVLSMNNDMNIYLCLDIVGLQTGKLSLEYVSDDNEIKKIHLNSFEEIVLKQNDKSFYQIQGYFDFNAKVMRKSGYPYIYITTCFFKNMKSCKEQMLKTKSKGNQIVSKTYQFNQKPCQDCFFLIKIESVQTAALTFHLISSQAQIQLKQQQIITDFVQWGQESKYLLTQIVEEDLLINIHAIEGNIQAKFTDNKQVNIMKSTDDDSKAIHFFIPQTHYNTKVAQSKFKNRNKQEVQMTTSPLQFYDHFQQFHLSISSTNQNTTATYSITYSSGQNKIILQDGLVTDIILQPGITTTFIYENERSKLHIFLLLSTKTVADLENIQIKTFYYKKVGKNEVKQEFKLQIPKVNRNTPYPTLLLGFPQQNYFQIEITNPSNKQIFVSMTMNHQELIYLPFNHEYPFILHPNQNTYFMTQINEPGFIIASIKRCDDSEPSLAYVDDYKKFMLEQYTNELILSNNPKLTEIIKIDKPGSFYIKMKASEYQQSMSSINLDFKKQKPESKFSMKPGNKGFIQYEFISTKKAKVTFSPANCGKEVCKNIKYYRMSTLDMQTLHTQLICSSTLFSVKQVYNKQQQALNAINFNQGSSNITFIEDLPSEISYLGIKAVAESGEQVYYVSIEIATIWGHLSRINKGYMYILFATIITGVFLLLYFVRYSARRGYTRINNINLRTGNQQQ